jgi:hypothetical protein
MFMEDITEILAHNRCHIALVFQALNYSLTLPFEYHMPSSVERIIPELNTFQKLNILKSEKNNIIVTGRCHSTDGWLPMSYPR